MMAAFTLTDDKTIVTQANMRLSNTMRLHLAGVGGDKKAIQLHFTNPQIATGQINDRPFDGPKGIWTIDISALALGNAEIHAKHNGKVVAKLRITVAKKLTLPLAATQEGLLVRLFLAEGLSPGYKAYNAAEAKKGMQWMYLVLKNRPENNPRQFLAPGAKTLADIVRARGQVEGFGNYPAINAHQQTRINDVVKFANDDSDLRQ